MALQALTQILNADLARELLGDFKQLTKHSNLYVRKRALIVLFKSIDLVADPLPVVQFIRDKIRDSDRVMVSFLMNILCPLFERDPS